MVMRSVHRDERQCYHRVITMSLIVRLLLLSVAKSYNRSKRRPPAVMPPAGTTAMFLAGNCAVPSPPAVLWMVSLTVSPSTDVTCRRTVALSGTAS
jgi:hypothetical protein